MNKEEKQNYSYVFYFMQPELDWKAKDKRENKSPF